MEELKTIRCLYIICHRFDRYVRDELKGQVRNSISGFRQLFGIKYKIGLFEDVIIFDEQEEVFNYNKFFITEFQEEYMTLQECIILAIPTFCFI